MKQNKEVYIKIEISVYKNISIEAFVSLQMSFKTNFQPFNSLQILINNIQD